MAAWWLIQSRPKTSSCFEISARVPQREGLCMASLITQRLGLVAESFWVKFYRPLSTLKPSSPVCNFNAAVKYQSTKNTNHPCLSITPPPLLSHWRTHTHTHTHTQTHIRSKRARWAVQPRKDILRRHEASPRIYRLGHLIGEAVHYDTTPFHV